MFPSGSPGHTLPPLVRQETPKPEPSKKKKKINLFCKPEPDGGLGLKTYHYDKSKHTQFEGRLRKLLKYLDFLGPKR